MRKKLFLIIISSVCAAAAGAFYLHLRNMQYERYYTILAFSPDGAQIICSQNGAELLLCDVASGTEIRRMKKPHYSGNADHVAFSPDGKTVVSGGTDGVILWDVASGAMIRLFEGSYPSASDMSGPCVAFSPDGSYVLSADAGEKLVLWDPKTGQPVRVFDQDAKSPQDVIRGVTFHPNGRTALTCGKRLVLWDVKAGKKMRLLQGHAKGAVAAEFIHGGASVLSCGEDAVAMTWDWSTGRMIRSFKLNQFQNVIAFSPDGRFMATGDFYSPVTLWDVEKGVAVRSLPPGRGVGVLSAAISPNGRFIAFGSQKIKGGRIINGRLKLWDLKSGRHVLNVKRRVSVPEALSGLIWKFIRI